MITIETFVVNFFSENTYILFDETKEAVIIDCGCLFPKEQKAVSDYITQHELTLRHNLCTHLHLDHTFGNTFIHATYGLSPEAHVEDVVGLPSLSDQARAFGVPLNIKEVPVEHCLSEGDIITFGNSELKVIAVPGHSPGGVAFYCEKEKFVIVGDSLFAGSIGRTDLWGGDQETLIDAIYTKLFSLPDETVVYNGHGPSTQINYEKLNNPYL